MSDYIVPGDLSLDTHRPRTLGNSLFLRLYDQVGPDPPLSRVKESLLEVVTLRDAELAIWQQVERLANERSTLTAQQIRCLESLLVAQWTGVDGRGRDGDTGKPLFVLLNRALVNESETLRHWVPFIRSLNEVLNCHGPSQALLVYRGSKFTKDEVPLRFPVGRLFRACMYIAASVDEAVAIAFARDGVIIEIDVPKGCHNSCEIYRLSNLQQEREVLFPPYSPFKVTSVVDDGDTVRVRLEVLDGMIVHYWERGDIEEMEGLDRALNPCVRAQPL